MQQQIQEMNPDVFVWFTNQPNTTEPLLPQFKYARSEKSELHATALYGTPFLEHFMKMAGAFPATAREYRGLELMYNHELPDDHAEVMMTALTTLSRPLMPAFWILTTKAEPFAPAPPLVNLASLKGQMTLMAMTLMAMTPKI